jgi:hypothetical protein
MECENEKHYNLLRQDIIQSMMSLYKLKKEDVLLTKAQALIAAEGNLKYRKQYEALIRAA